ncbi:hypothetical protein HanRHA438_Chr03g0117351 [Helianthus annuus]|nr:hypothetical protein HanRHA438_Chr03g0117351 [Helianthus annuus]
MELIQMNRQSEWDYIHQAFQLLMHSYPRLAHFATVSYLGIILQYTYLSIRCLFRGKNMWRVDLFHSSGGRGGDRVVMVVVIT